MGNYALFHNLLELREGSLYFLLNRGSYYESWNHSRICWGGIA